MAGEQRDIRTRKSRLAAKGDQALGEFRDAYETFDNSQKLLFIQALEKAAEANEIMRCLPAKMHAAIETEWISYDEQGELLGSGHAELSPKLLLKAIRAWEQGDCYSPGGLGFIS